MHKEYKQKILENAQNSIFSFFIKRKRIAYLMAIGVILAGTVASVLISKENAPKIDFGVVNISTIYNGANAKDMDSLVTDKIEKEIDDISGIKHITSTSRNSFSNVSVEFEPNVDMSEKMNELRSGVDTVKDDIPDGAEDPEIDRVNSSLTPIFSLHLSGEVSNVLLRDHAENLKDILEKNPAIEEAIISGQGEREFFIDLDPSKLRQYNLTSLNVINAVKSANRDFPAGNFDVQGFDYNLRISGKYKNTEDIKNTVIKSFSGEKGNSFISIGDVANVYEDFVKDEVIEKLTVKDGENLSKRLNTVTISVKKSDKKNIFSVDGIARKIVSDYAKKNFHGEIRVDYLSEMIVDVTKSYDTVFSNGIQSIIIVVFLMILFVGFKEGLITGIIIPLSFLATIAVLFARGDSLSFMSNFGMILALGIIVDTAIVIVEGIHDGLKHGFTADEAAMISVEEFKGPLFSGFLTTIAVFVPLLVLPGIIGKYLSFIPITVSFVLLFSLLTSFLIIPAIAASILGRKKIEKNSNVDEKKSLFKKINLFVEKKFLHYGKIYKFFLREKISHKFFRRTIIFSVIVAFVTSLFLPVKFTMFPSDDVNYFSVSIKDEPGSNTLKTEEFSKKLEKEIVKYPEVEYVSSSIIDDSVNILVQLYEKEIREDKGQKQVLR